MKHYFVVLTALIGTTIAGSGTARAQEKSAAISLRIEKGDTYINLFGPDWQKAYQESHVTIYRKGKFVASPDILIQGGILTLTRDVRLTTRISFVTPRR